MLFGFRCGQHVDDNNSWGMLLSAGRGVGNSFDTETKGQSATGDDVEPNREEIRSNPTWADVVRGNRQTAQGTCAKSNVRKENAREEPAEKPARVEKFITKN